MQVLPIYLSILTSFLMLPFALLLLPLSCISSLEKLMMLNNTTHEGSLICLWISSGLLSVVGYDYVQHLLWE